MAVSGIERSGGHLYCTLSLIPYNRMMPKVGLDAGQGVIDLITGISNATEADDLCMHGACTGV